MNEWRSDGKKLCCFHPKELVVGICALCLKERLLVLAAKKNSLLQTRKTFSKRDKPPSPLTKIFALTTLLNRLEVKDHIKPSVDDHTSSSSPDGKIYLFLFFFFFLEKGRFFFGCFAFLNLPSIGKIVYKDSFISIKFENNGIASWEKGKFSEVNHDQQRKMPCNEAEKIKSLVEHSKPRGTLRWRRRIGHLIHLIRFKRSNKGNICHVGTKHRKSKV